MFPENDFTNLVIKYLHLHSTSLANVLRNILVAIHFETQPGHDVCACEMAKVGRTACGCNQGLCVSTHMLCTSKAVSVNAGSGA